MVLPACCPILVPRWRGCTCPPWHSKKKRERERNFFKHVVNNFPLTNVNCHETTYQLISGSVDFLAPLERAVGSVVAHDLLFDGGGVVAPRSRLDHALQTQETTGTFEQIQIKLNSFKTDAGKTHLCANIHFFIICDQYNGAFVFIQWWPFT